jgi:hypothetical protein
MQEGYYYVNDPLGNRIAIPPRFQTMLDGEEEIYDDLATVFHNPLMVLELNTGRDELHYYRAIGWNITLLASAFKTKDGWEVFSCTRNPSMHIIKELITHGRQLK